MEITIWSISGLLTILGVIIAAYLSYQIYKYNRLSQAWLSMTFAFLLLVFSRLIIFSEDFGLLQNLEPIILKTWNTIILIFVTILFILGLWSMLKQFESFDIIEKKTREKIKTMKKH